MRVSVDRPWAAISLIGLVSVLFTLVAAAGGERTPAVRQSVSLNANWRFFFGSVGSQATTADFDDSAWESIEVPHTWNRLGEMGATRTAATNNKRGTGWYRLRFAGPSAKAKQRHFLQFDAVATLAEVWLNGTKLGSHAGAFSRFRFDVTDVLRADEPNLLVVKADNTKPTPGASTQDIIPLDGDFFIHGGIYRGVAMITTAEVHVDLSDYAGPGVYAHTAQITQDRADVVVLAKLRNDGGKQRSVSVVTRILDAEGREVAQGTKQVRIEANAKAEVADELAVRHPRLWNGREDPHLYRVQVELRERKTVLDQIEQPLGIRSIRVDPNEGLFLNGKHVSLRGVSRHQDRAGKGWALGKSEHDEDMALIAELGANAVRFAHYQHASEWFELADRYGMLVWAEIPFVHQANFTMDEPTPALVANARQQLMESIRQNYNHPAVFTWSVGNEVNIGNFLHERKAGKSLGLLRELHELARREDPSRLTTFADCCETPPMRIPGEEPLAGTTNLIGYNRYFGWYYGQPSDLGAALDTLHERHPSLPIGVSEYGAGGALTQHTDNPRGGIINMMGRPHPEEIESWYHERTWPQIASRRFIWGSFVWNMFDFSSDLREEGDMIDVNDKGLVSYDRKTKKDAFYYYKAQWSTDPVVHITSGRHADRAYATTDVRVYSNAPSVRLKLNDKDLGTAFCQERVCTLRDVKLDAGANTVTASAEFSGKTVEHTVQWRAPSAANGLRIDVGNLVGYRAADGQLFGSDNFFTGGEPRLLNGLSGGGFVAVKQARKTVEGAGDPTLFEGYRVGEFSYDIPLPNGEWNVTVHSFERDGPMAQTRTFDVIANDQVHLKAWSPAKAAGGVMKAAQGSFKVRVEDGRLRLRFAPVGGPALVAAITVAP